MIIDTHCHLDDARYTEDLDTVIARALEAGVKGIMLPGADIEDLPKAKAIAHRYPHVFYAAGVHPYHHAQYDEQVLEHYLQDEKCIAVGECGLDYFRLPKDEQAKIEEKAAQKEVFRAHIALATKHQKPLIVHVRESSADSFEMLNTFAAGKVPSGVLHCYNASEVLLPLAAANFYFGIGGVLTFKNEKKLGEIVTRIPKDKLVLETDAPYLTPHPKRGERNEPAYTAYVASHLARVLGMSEEALMALTTQNAKALFKAFEKLD
ncbi:TatD family hydrolase [Sulfurospirillum sp. T05]|uniref:TatD family hydrolase n=1 Tax=Sulfurospirillum tamanense TaxID=2813362 RepID=A0ABS2WTP6_9BACT|nr:TatD family hydrolase [Sulfurospirillum tamanensis]MBN2964748.1 TatD family hydrolase [Sulfurospirillum tamanensis]